MYNRVPVFNSAAGSFTICDYKGIFFYFILQNFSLLCGPFLAKLYFG